MQSRKYSLTDETRICHAYGESLRGQKRKTTGHFFHMDKGSHTETESCTCVAGTYMPSIQACLHKEYMKSDIPRDSPPRSRSPSVVFKSASKTRHRHRHAAEGTAMQGQPELIRAVKRHENKEHF